MANYDFSAVKKNMESKGYKVNVFENREAAAAYIDSQIDGKTVGFGGSVSLHQLEIFPKLATHNTVYWHDEKPADMTVIETRTAATRAQVYISSVNGISENGEIVNLDNTGNRVAAITYGPEKVFLVIGSNKIAPTLEDAIWRVRNVASPLNAKRLNRKTPCAVHADKCYNCQSPERICRNLSIFLDRPTGVEYDIVFVDEELGY